MQAICKLIICTIRKKTSSISRFRIRWRVWCGQRCVWGSDDMGGHVLPSFMIEKILIQVKARASGPPFGSVPPSVGLPQWSKSVKL